MFAKSRTICPFHLSGSKSYANSNRIYQTSSQKYFKVECNGIFGVVSRYKERQDEIEQRLEQAWI